MRGRPEDWTRVVRAHAHDTLALLTTSGHPHCLKMARDEVKFIERWMTHVVFSELPATLPDSYFVAVIVCPGDDLTLLAAWMKKHGGDRVRFYLHEGADIQQLACVRDAGLELRHVRPEHYAAYGALHQRLGLDLSDQIYEDFRPR